MRISIKMKIMSYFLIISKIIENFVYRKEGFRGQILCTDVNALMTGGRDRPS